MKYSELANDSQRLGWVLSQLINLVSSVESYREAHSHESEMLLLHDLAGAKETIKAVQEDRVANGHTQSLIGG